MLILNKPYINKKELSDFILKQKIIASNSMKHYFFHGGSYDNYNKIVGFYECLDLIQKKFNISLDGDLNIYYNFN